MVGPSRRRSTPRRRPQRPRPWDPSPVQLAVIRVGAAATALGALGALGAGGFLLVMAFFAPGAGLGGRGVVVLFGVVVLLFGRGVAGAARDQFRLVNGFGGPRMLAAVLTIPGAVFLYGLISGPEPDMAEAFSICRIVTAVLVPLVVLSLAAGLAIDSGSGQAPRR